MDQNERREWLEDFELALNTIQQLQGELSVQRAHSRRLKERLAAEIAARAELELLVREAGLLPTVVSQGIEP